MNALAVSKGFALNLLPEERVIAIAIQGAMVCKLQKEEIQNSLLKIIENTYLTIGWTYDGKNGAIQAIKCSEDLKKHFGSLTMEEVSIAFERGVRKEYGEFVGLSAATYYVWLKEYFTSSVRMETKKKQAQYIMDQTKEKELSQEEKDEILKQGVFDAFQIFKKNGQYDDIGNPVYNYLDRLKRIPFTHDEKQAFMEQAKERIKQDLENRKTASSDIYQRRSLVIQIGMVGTYQDQIISEAKKIALLEYFRDLIVNEFDIKNILK